MTTDLPSRIRSRALDPATRTDMAGVFPGDLPDCATVEHMTDTERRLGCRLPPLLAELYKTIGNGGWGPGYGLMGIVGGLEGEAGDGTAVDLYEVFRGDDPEDPGWKWP